MLQTDLMKSYELLKCMTMAEDDIDKEEKKNWK